jgi:phosphotransferase system HPr (HPr) family protein
VLEITLTIRNKVGLHARPALVFVQQSSKFASSIYIRNATKPIALVEGKSILGTLTQGGECGYTVELEIARTDECEPAQRLKQLIETDFAGCL